MSTKEIAAAFTQLLKDGQHEQAAERYNSDDIVSIEAMDGPMAECRGREAVQQKSQWWYDNHEVHSTETAGPFCNGNQFSLIFRIDVTVKASGERMAMEEVGLYTVASDRIVEERFFY